MVNDLFHLDLQIWIFVTKLTVFAPGGFKNGGLNFGSHVLTHPGIRTLLLLAGTRHDLHCPSYLSTGKIGHKDQHKFNNKQIRVHSMNPLSANWLDFSLTADTNLSTALGGHKVQRSAYYMYGVPTAQYDT